MKRPPGIPIAEPDASRPALPVDESQWARLNYSYLRNWCLMSWPYPEKVDLLGYTRALAASRPAPLIQEVPRTGKLLLPGGFHQG